MLDSKINLSHDSLKNYKLRQIAWITNTIEEDKSKLEEMFWPTHKERLKNKRLNKEAKEWLIKKRLMHRRKVKDSEIKFTNNSAFFSSMNDSIDQSVFDSELIV